MEHSCIQRRAVSREMGSEISYSLSMEAGRGASNSELRNPHAASTLRSVLLRRRKAPLDKLAVNVFLVDQQLTSVVAAGVGEECALAGGGLCCDVLPMPVSHG